MKISVSLFLLSLGLVAATTPLPGVWLQSDNATVDFGKEGSVVRLFRSSDGELTTTGNLLINDGSVDLGMVADSLTAVLDRVSALEQQLEKNATVINTLQNQLVELETALNTTKTELNATQTMLEATQDTLTVTADTVATLNTVHEYILAEDPDWGEGAEMASEVWSGKSGDPDSNSIADQYQEWTHIRGGDTHPRRVFWHRQGEYRLMTGFVMVWRVKRYKNPCNVYYGTDVHLILPEESYADAPAGAKFETGGCTFNLQWLTGGCTVNAEGEQYMCKVLGEKGGVDYDKPNILFRAYTANPNGDGASPVSEKIAQVYIQFTIRFRPCTYNCTNVDPI